MEENEARLQQILEKLEQVCSKYSLIRKNYKRIISENKKHFEALRFFTEYVTAGTSQGAHENISFQDKNFERISSYIMTLKSENIRLNDEVQNLENNHKDRILRIEGSLAENNLELDLLRSIRDNLEDEIEELRNKYSTDIEKAQQNNVSKIAEIQESYESRIRSEQKEHEDIKIGLEQTIEQLSAKITDQFANFNETMKSLESKHGLELDNLMNEFQIKLDESNARFKSEVDKIEMNHQEELKSTESELHQKISELQQEKETLQKTLSSLEEEQKRIKFLYEEKLKQLESSMDSKLRTQLIEYKEKLRVEEMRVDSYSSQLNEMMGILKIKEKQITILIEKSSHQNKEYNPPNFINSTRGGQYRLPESFRDTSTFPPLAEKKDQGTDDQIDISDQERIRQIEADFQDELREVLK